MSFGMSSITTEAESNGQSGALFEGLTVPTDSSAVLTRGMPRGAPRVQSAVRNQIELRACDLDASLPANHQARAVWAFVASLDLQAAAQRQPGTGPVARAHGHRRGQFTDSEFVHRRGPARVWKACCQCPFWSKLQSARRQRREERQ